MRILILSVITFFATMALDTLATETPKESILDLLKKERQLALQEHKAASEAIAASQAATASQVDAAVASMDSVKNEAKKLQDKILAIAEQTAADSINLDNMYKLNGF
jgi:uncharacterized protein (DUF2147 family)